MEVGHPPWAWMALFQAAVFVATVSTGCNSPENTVRSFLEADSVEGKAEWLASPESSVPRLEAHYKKRDASRGVDIGKIEVEPVRLPGDCTGLREVGAFLEYEGENSGFKRRHQFLVDGNNRLLWEASVGFNEWSTDALEAQRPTSPVSLRVLASLHDYFNYEFSEMRSKTYSIRLDLKRGSGVTGYSLKDSKSGQWLYNKLKDGEKHRLVVEIAYNDEAFLAKTGNKSSSGVVLINSIVREGWQDNGSCGLLNLGG